MMRIALLSGALFIVSAGVALPAAANECSGVVLNPVDSNATREQLQETQQVLFKRVVAAYESEELKDSLFVSLERDHFVMDAPGLACPDAISLAESSLIPRTEVEIGLAGGPVQFRASDVESHVESVDGQVRFRLREHAIQPFRRLTRANIGKTVVVRVNGAATEIPIQAEQTSGLIILERSAVPEDAFTAETLLPIELEAGQCGPCLGKYK